MQMPPPPGFAEKMIELGVPMFFEENVIGLNDIRYGDSAENK